MAGAVVPGASTTDPSGGSAIGRDGSGSTSPLLVAPPPSTRPGDKAKAAAATPIQEFNAPPTTAPLSPVGAFPPGHKNFLQRTPLWLSIGLLVLLTTAIAVFFSGVAPTTPSVPLKE